MFVGPERWRKEPDVAGVVRSLKEEEEMVREREESEERMMGVECVWVREEKMQ